MEISITVFKFNLTSCSILTCSLACRILLFHGCTHRRSNLLLIVHMPNSHWTPCYECNCFLFYSEKEHSCCQLKIRTQSYKKFRNFNKIIPLQANIIAYRMIISKIKILCFNQQDWKDFQSSRLCIDWKYLLNFIKIWYYYYNVF